MDLILISSYELNATLYQNSLSFSFLKWETRKKWLELKNENKRYTFLLDFNIVVDARWLSSKSQIKDFEIHPQPVRWRSDGS